MGPLKRLNTVCTVCGHCQRVGPIEKKTWSDSSAVSFHPFLQTGTPETLITWTCEHTKSPTHPSACRTHPSSHGNLFIPSNVTYALPHARRRSPSMWQRGSERGGRKVYSRPESPHWQLWGTCRVSPGDRSNLRDGDRRRMGADGGWEGD